MSKFQIIFTAIFVVFIITGVVIFATYKSKTDANALPPITVWGSFPGSVFNQFISETNLSRSQAVQVSYREIEESSFDKIFIEALARGEGPDAILIPQSLIYSHEDKVIPIPYNILSQRDFKNTFVQQAELYLHPASGSLALPFSMDPLVIYWNRDIFTNAGIATFPRFWSDFSTLNTKITLKDPNQNIRRSLVALGEFSNVAHAREILGALILQSGNPVSSRDGDQIVSSTLENNPFSDGDTTLAALQFYTKFSDPRSADYTWNRSIANSKNSFLAGNLATYIGFASELFDIKQKNQNLDFDVAPLPQAPGGKNRVTYGSMYGLSIVKSTKDVNGTYKVLSELITPESLNELTNLTYLPPVRRDMLASGSTDPYLSIFFDSALISRAWLDSNKAESYRIFQEMVDDITSGRRSAFDAVKNADEQFDFSLKNK